MKPRFYLLFTLFCLAVNSYLIGQDKAALLEKRLDDCGCNWGESSPNLAILKEEICKTFGNNEVVNELIRNIADSPGDIVKKNIQKWLKAVLKKDKDEAWRLLRDKLDASALEMAEKIGDESILKATLICNISTELHFYYLNHIEEFGENAEQRKFYESLGAVPAAPVQDSMPITNQPAKVVGDDNNKATIGTFPSTLILMLIAIVAALAFAYLWYSEKNKQKTLAQNLVDKESALSALKKTIEEKNNSFLTDKARLEQEIAGLKQQLEAKKREISELEHLKDKSNVMEPIPLFVKEESKQIQRYLFAPSQDGIFYQNSVKDALSSDTFYKIILNGEDDVEAGFELIRDADLLSRAEAMAQEYLLSACDLQGKGKININTLEILPGRVKREGGGWKIIKKVVLRWS